MLTVSRSITPPGIVGNYRHSPGTLAHVVGAEFSINRFVADCTAYCDAVPEMQHFSRVSLAFATAHQRGLDTCYAAYEALKREEDCRVRGKFCAHDQPALVVLFHIALRIKCERAVVALEPAVTERTCECGRGAAAVADFESRSAEEHFAARMSLEELRKEPDSRRRAYVIEYYVGSECFRGDEQCG